MIQLARLLALVPSARPDAQHVRAARAQAVPFATGSDDVFVNIEVKNALLRHPEFLGAGIHVSTSRGIVQLSGFIASRRLIASAVEVARRVPGVRSVRNDMLVA